MPVAFVRREEEGAFVPVAGRTFRIGRRLTCDLVMDEAEVAPHHATLRYVKGEWMLTARDGCAVFVNGESVPLIPLRDGDRVGFRARGRAWTFRDRLEGAFVPPGASLAQAWLAHPGSAEDAYGPGALGPGEGVGGRDPARCRRVASPYGSGSWVVKTLGPVRAPDDAQRHLRLLAAIGGAPHAGLARVVEGGLAAGGDGPQRWVATRWVPGESARARVEAGGLAAAAALRVLRGVAAALARLHARGVVHRDVAPGNVILTPDGDAVLIDYGQAFLAEAGAPPSRGVVGTPGYVAPEEVLAGGAAVSAAADCYGLAALGYALITGAAPAQGADVLDTLAGSTAAPPPPGALGIALPDVLETVILGGLAAEPEARPTAPAFRKALEFAAAQLGLGGVAS